MPPVELEVGGEDGLAPSFRARRAENRSLPSSAAASCRKTPGTE